MFAARDDHILFFDAADEAEYGFAGRGDGQGARGRRGDDRRAHVGARGRADAGRGGARELSGRHRVRSPAATGRPRRHRVFTEDGNGPAPLRRYVSENPRADPHGALSSRAGREGPGPDRRAGFTQRYVESYVSARARRGRTPGRDPGADRSGAREEIKLYFDYKSPFAYLASGPAFELAVALRRRGRAGFPTSSASRDPASGACGRIGRRATRTSTPAASRARAVSSSKGRRRSTTRGRR